MHAAGVLRLPLLTALFVSVLAPGAFAAIVWKEQVVELRPKLFATDTEAVFPFTNTGATPVTIVSATASCGCTVPALDKKTFAPGEIGELRASYHIGERVGEQHSTITVQTDTPGEGYVRLELLVRIPEPVALSPRVLSWNSGEAPDAKQIAVKIHPGTGWKAVDVTSADPAWKAVLKPGESPGDYVVEITPPQTETRCRAVFSLVTDAPDRRTFALFAFVR